MMDFFPVFLIWDDRLDPEFLFQGSAIKIVFHGESGSQQAHGLQSRIENPFCRHLDDTEQRDTDGALDRLGQLVHGIGAQKQHVST